MNHRIDDLDYLNNGACASLVAFFFLEKDLFLSHGSSKQEATSLQLKQAWRLVPHINLDDTAMMSVFILYIIPLYPIPKEDHDDTCPGWRFSERR